MTKPENYYTFTAESGSDDLPTIPVILNKILSVTGDDNASAKQLGDIISKDQSICSKVLKIANSSYYGFPETVSSINHAIALLGFSFIKNIVLYSSVFSTFSVKGKKETFDHEGFWIHSIGCAETSLALAKKLNYNQDTAYMAGLLHDIGKIYFEKYFYLDYKKVLEKVSLDNCTILAAENSVLGTDHCKVGSMLAVHWKFPDAISEAICHHHYHVSENHNSLSIAIVHIADIICKAEQIGNSGDSIVLKFNQEALEFLSLDQTVIDTIASQISAKKEQFYAFLEVAE